MGEHFYEILLALGVLSPMVSFWILVFAGPKLGKPTAGWTAVVLGMGVPLALATWVLISWWWGEDSVSRAALTENAFRFHWADIGSVPITLGVKLDSLTVAMYFMVTFVAFWIFVFSIGYMSGHSDEVDGQSKYSRFFAYLSLFAFSMLGLVISSNLLFLFIFWELVGLCSYLLIGFYFDKAYASAAAIKAFVTNRVGDFGFLIGLMLVFYQLGTLDLDQAAAVFAEQAATGSGIFSSDFSLFGWSLATVMGVGLFCGAMGKSAQFPLHVWLPDAMAGPTPVSALIHAATMVAAGVYLVARVFRLMTPDALMFIALIGCLTLTLMALVAIVQVDIKKCLAYSTLSQLGYMIFGLGCGAWIAALFHLMTHAFFKAMLFLCSGQVIEGCHHEQDMRKMGGLRKKMPVTCWTFFVGVLAISGAGIAGTTIGLGGFFSKDEILAVAYVRAFEWDDAGKHEVHDGDAAHALGSTHPVTGVRLVSDPVQNAHGGFARAEARGAANAHGEDTQHVGHDDSARASIFGTIPALPKWMFYLALFTAYVTPFYMMRCWWMTFMGKPRDENVYRHAHESKLMYVPLAVLAVGTLLASYFLFRPLIADAATAATAAPLVLALDGHEHTAAIGAAHRFLTFGVGGAFIIAFLAAIAIYRRGLETPERIRRALAPLHLVLVHKYFFDEVYDVIWVKGCLLLAKVARFIDTWIVDSIFDMLAAATERIAAFSGLILDKHGVDGVVNGVARSSTDFAGFIRRWQTGRIRHYVIFATGVATVVFLWIWLAGASNADAAVVSAGM
ncbi:MAG: NADH-quinone oxidoreductase subunit L [Planctomycetes bacterium]|nr:NADH-quinone oxidoreductase subunit L [Planctomycetota bacterium]